MANHVSALKRARQTETRTATNRANRSRVRTSLRAMREALVKGDVKAAQEQFKNPSASKAVTIKRVAWSQHRVRNLIRKACHNPAGAARAFSATLRLAAA